MNEVAKEIEWARAKELAEKAGVDWRTIQRVARGEHVRGRAGVRARDVLVKEGILEP